MNANQANEDPKQWIREALENNIEHCCLNTNGVCPINMLAKVICRVAIKRKVSMEDVLKVLDNKHSEVLEELTSKKE